jgi:cytochrome c oxidase assembly protein subunit 11
VRFDSNVNPALKWDFRAVSEPVTLVPGESVVINYRATNLSDVTTTGTATFNVTPQKAGPYFMKMECFCFTEQALAPGESIDMPVSFFIDPEIASDVNTQDVDEIVLSYTFFPLAGS